MEKKNVNILGWIGLILALLSLVAIIVSYIPMTPLEPNPEVNFFSDTNVEIAGGAVFMSIAAIVIGAISCKDKDKKGPRKAGWIIGIFMLIGAIMSTGVLALFAQVTAYVNHDPDSIFEKTFKDDPQAKKEMDEFINKLIGNPEDTKTESQTESQTESKTLNE